MTVMKHVFFALFVIFCFGTLDAFEYKEAKDSNSMTYQYIPGDPFGTRFYTLSNGMKLYLSRNTKEPRIQTAIAVRAGSAQDPLQSTGLAHYFEHMMFKGNDRIASLDWEKEEKLLLQIEELFEQYRREQDPEKREAIYKQIDTLSQEAAKYSNDEYWLLVKSIGAKGTNAYTSLDETVYVNDIPASHLEKFLKLESVRFSHIALRRFYTELETVYEEFNMGQDKDSRLAYQKVMELMFPAHPYGRRVIGLPEHLKAPSMRDIRTFFTQWYRPENMALIFSGALDYDKTAFLAEKYFGSLKQDAPAGSYAKITEKPITAVRRADLTGPQAEQLILAYRFEATPENEVMLDLIGDILSNGKCGLFDKDVILPQKVLKLSQGTIYLRDYYLYLFIAQPKKGQTLDDLKQIIHEELAKLKKGDFPDWLPQAVVNNFRLSLITLAESRSTAVNAFTDQFIRQYSCADALNAPDKMEKITKQQIMDFAEKNFRDDNYAIVYKHSGKAENRVHAAKPAITPVPVPETASKFARDFAAMPALPEPEAEFPDFAKGMKIQKIDAGRTVYKTANTENERFSLSFVFPVGSLNNLKLPLAFSLASYLGYNGKTAAEQKEELYKLAGSISFSSGYFYSTITLSGLQRNFDALMKCLPSRFEPDEKAWEELRASILKNRENAKKNQGTVFDHAYRYVYYGGLESLSNLYLPEAELMKVTAKELAGLLNSVMFNAPVDIVYYGPEANPRLPLDSQVRFLHKQAVTKFQAKPPAENRVILVPYPSVQVIARLARADSILERPFTFSSIYGEYAHRKFWNSIREERGLAYAASSFYTIPTIMLGDYSTTGAYVMTQPDKLVTAADAMLAELDQPKMDPALYQNSVQGILSRIRNKRIQVESYYWVMKDLERRGLKQLPEQTVYEALPRLTPEEFAAEWKKRITGKPTLLVVMGDLSKIDRKALEKYGKVSELTIDEIFRK